MQKSITDTLSLLTSLTLPFSLMDRGICALKSQRCHVLRWGIIFKTALLIIVADQDSVSLVLNRFASRFILAVNAFGRYIISRSNLELIH